MVTPNQLQTATEIGHVAECSPSALFAKGNEPANERFESAEIQREKKASHCRHREHQNDKRHRAERPATGDIKDDANSDEHEYQETQDLDENIDQNAGDGQTGCYPELGKKPRADGIAADDGQRKQ